jgi:hypothetical protein
MVGMIKTSGQLALWLAVIAGLSAMGAGLPSSVPDWIDEWVSWCVAALTVGLATYVKASSNVTLPAERELGERLVTRVDG